jgi:hypothetical protein
MIIFTLLLQEIDHESLVHNYDPIYRSQVKFLSSEARRIVQQLALGG